MAYYDWENKKKLIEDLKLSYSTSDFLNKQNLVATSGNYETFKKWMKTHNMNPQENFLKKNPKLKKNKTQALSVEEVFIENSVATRNYVNNLIAQHKLLEHKCSGCGNTGSWNGKSLTLQLEHKNGEGSDNRIENLEYLCPNCHSQTLTYGSKNRHNRMFEQRIKDLEEYNNKVICYNEYISLSKKWEIDTGTVKSWLREYADKIKSCGLNITQEVYIPNRSHLSTEICDTRMEDLKSISDIGEDWQKQLSKKWNISLSGVKKWIKENDQIFYRNNYELSPTKKAKIYLEELYDKVKKLLEECKLKDKLDLNLFTPLFNNNKAACVSYIKRVYPSEYSYFYPLPNCSHCESPHTRRCGWRKLKAGNLQRYDCLDCAKQFY